MQDRLAFGAEHGQVARPVVRGRDHRLDFQLVPRLGPSARHRVRPGITGLAQVKGSRGRMEATQQLEQRLAYDLEYINNYSLFLDAKIAIATVYVVLGRSNAY